MHKWLPFLMGMLLLGGAAWEFYSDRSETETADTPATVAAPKNRKWIKIAGGLVFMCLAVGNLFWPDTGAGRDRVDAWVPFLLGTLILVDAAEDFNSDRKRQA